MATTIEKRHPDAADQRDRIDGYLRRSGLAARTPRVVPLTGDASDRRYFRVLPPDAPSIVLSLHAAPFDFDTLPFVNVARLLAQMPVPIPRVLGHADDLGVLALEDLGDVTLQAHLGAATPAEHAALYRQAVALDRHAAAARRGARVAGVPALRDRVRRREADLGAGLLHQALPRGLPRRRRSRRRRARRCARSSAPIVEELAAEPRVLCHRDYHSRNLMLHDGRLYIIDFQDARMGPDTYDLVSLLRDSYVDLPEQTVDELIAYFLALKGETGARDGLPRPLRPDGAAAQPEGARHVRLPDDRAPQPGLHPVHPAHAALRAGQPRADAALRARCATLLAALVDEFR